MADNDGYQDGKGAPSGGTLFVLSIIFLPSVIVGWLFYQLFRRGRQRLSVVASAVLVFELACLIAWSLSDKFSGIMEILKNLDEISTNWTLAISPILIIDLAIGGLLGLFFVAWDVRQMKVNPYRVQISGNWMYKFKYNRTPLQMLRRKKSIQGLKSGAFAHPSKAPLGLDEENNDSVTYRYGTEAVKQTLISGAAGSGKALHKDTKIPTISGMKTVAEVSIGDTLFDETGSKTKVVGKYQPMTEDHFLLKFSDGTEVKACGDHLWSVEILNQVQARDERKNSLKKAIRNIVAKKKFYETAEVLKSILEDAPKIETIATRDLLDFESETDGPRYAIPVAGSVDYADKSLPITAYAMGAWLAAGSTYGGSITHTELAIKDECEKSGTPLLSERTLEKDGKANSYKWTFAGLFKELRKINLVHNGRKGVSKKYIPDAYLYGSTQQRIDLIRGLVDAIGTCSEDGAVSIIMNESQVVHGARVIVSSLGWKATAVQRKGSHKHLDDGSVVNDGDRWFFSFYPDVQLFAVESKATLLAKSLEDENIHNSRRYIVSVESIEDAPEDYFCFEVDSPSHLFLCTESFITTHNTITLLSLINNDIQHGAPVIVIDFKRSPELASKLAAWTKDAGGNFYHFVNGSPKSYDVKNSPGQAFYDPLRNGSPTAKADMVLGMRDYDTASAVYKAAMQQLLQVLFAMLKYADREKAPSIAWDAGGVYQVASAVTGSNLTELASACEGTPIQADAEAIDQLSRGKTQIRHAMDELQGQIRTIVASEYGRWLKQSEEGANIDLFEMTKGTGNVILFSLNSDAEPDFARYVGAMILSDLTGVSAKRRNQKLTNQVNVYVDEFQAVPPTSVTSLLEKSRESRVAMTLAQQSFEQIIASSEKNGEAYLLSILDTCSNFIVHNGATEDSAERLSKILGKKWVTSYRQSNQNQSSFLSTNWGNKRNSTVMTSEEERWVFEPRQFMSLSSPDKNNGYKSTAVIVNKTSSDPIFKDRTGGATARTVWMIPDQKVIQEYYEPTFDGDDDDGYKAPKVPASIIPAAAPRELTERSHEQPEEISYFAAKALLAESEQSHEEFETVYEDDGYEEDEDDNFTYETIEDEDDREMREASELPALPPLEFKELPEISEKPAAASEPQQSSNPNGRRSAVEPTSYSSRFGADFKPATLDRSKSSNGQKSPVVEPQKPKVEKDFDKDNFSLPNLEF